MTDLMYGMDPTIQGSTFQNRTVKQCQSLCDVLQGQPSKFCDVYCPQLDPELKGWFNMADEEVAKALGSF